MTSALCSCSENISLKRSDLVVRIYIYIYVYKNGNSCRPDRFGIFVRFWREEKKTCLLHPSQPTKSNNSRAGADNSQRFKLFSFQNCFLVIVIIAIYITIRSDPSKISQKHSATIEL